MGLRRLVVHRKKIALFIVLSLLVMVVLFFRGPYVSNLLKKAILPNIQSATGYDVIAQKLLINLFPLSVEAKEIKAFDDDGLKVFAARRVKAYVSLSGIFRRQVEIQRVLVVEPEFQADRARVEEVVDKIKGRDLRGKDERFFRVKVRAVTVKDGTFSFRDEEAGYAFAAGGAEAEIVLRQKPEIMFSIREADCNAPGYPSFKTGVRGEAVLSADKVEVKRIDFDFYGSELHGSGAVSLRGEADLADFSIEARLLMSAAKQIFDLKNPGEGVLYAKGKVRFTDGKYPFIDLGARGDFYLETLLELLRVNEKHILKGYVDFDGRLHGNVPDLTATANARIKRGNFFGVRVDEGECAVDYGDRRLSFREGKVRLFGGRADVDVSLLFQQVRDYTVDITFADADIGPVLELIHLSWLKLPYGKVEGNLHSSGSRFEPVGRAVFRSRKTGDDVLGRVRMLSGRYQLSDKQLTLSGFNVRTGKSSMDFDGKLDLSKNLLDMRGNIETSDILDLAAPYARGIEGRGEIGWNLGGTFEDPLIEGNIRLQQASFKGYAIGNTVGEVSYSKGLLAIRSAKAENGPVRHRASGNIKFPAAKAILEFQEPVYDIKLNAERADLGALARLLGFKEPVEGSFNSDLTLTGAGSLPVYAGRMAVTDASVRGRPVSSANISFSYDSNKLEVGEALVEFGDSHVRLKGRVSRADGFDFEASSEKVMLGDIFPREIPLEYEMSLEARGTGTFDKPDIRAELGLRKGKFRGAGLGGGSVKAVLKDSELLLDASMVDKTVALRGKATLAEDFPWNAEIDIKRGRYDFIVAAFLATVPEDLMVSMSGSVSLNGTRDSLNASVRLPRLNVSMFGQGFINRSDVVFSIEDKMISLSEVEMRSGNTFVRMGGSVVLDSSYDLTLEGSSSLAPLSGILKGVESVKGDAAFVFSLRGGWENPSLDGGLSVTKGTLGLKGYPQRFSLIDGFIYVDDDRVVVEKVEAKLGGGNVAAAGVVQLKRLEVEKYYFNILVDNVSLSISRDFNMNVGGELLLRGSPDSQGITGDLQILRATYRERIEWKSWLLYGQKKAPRAKENWADRLDLKVRVYGRDHIRVDNNLARASLDVDMVVGGTLGSPRLYGRVQSKEGKVFFRNSEFNILSAVADFVDPVSNRPTVRIQAETFIQGYHIWLNLDGRIEQFDLTFSSDPPLDDVEILGLLTLGGFGERLEGMESGIGAAEAASFLTGKLQDVVEERFKDITGLDRFQIDPYVSGSSETVTPRLTVSKRLLGERLYVTYSSAVGADVEQELRLEYLLGDNISLLGGQDERGSIGGDIKFRFRFE